VTAANQAAKHKHITDSTVKKLLAMVGTIGSTILGSEERKSYDLARKKSATVWFLPQIFMFGTKPRMISLIARGYTITSKTSTANACGSKSSSRAIPSLEVVFSRVGYYFSHQKEETSLSIK
jgi:acetylornithine/succinyldiaminopimelate/putrescine aminotransferase